MNKTGQPILVGTDSVEESERLAYELRKAGVDCRILNAKNDALEAKIIAKAGELGAVTVSTNMAGRGVDIKLGGEREEQKEQVAALGGLYVIGTCRHESSRVDDQLRGRAGRQGDPGESRFFISLEDDLIKNYGFKKYLTIENNKIHKDIAKCQRLVEGYYSDIRRQLWKYSHIIEQQRQIIHKKRMDILLDKMDLQLLYGKAAEKHSLLKEKLGIEALYQIEKQITLYSINKCWADYLDFVSYVQEGIHLVSIANKNPLDEFNRIVIAAFDNMLQEIDEDIVNIFNDAKVSKEGIFIGAVRLKGPSSTWTYLMQDSHNQFSRLPYLFETASTHIKGTLFSLKSIYNKIMKK